MRHSRVIADQPRSILQCKRYRPERYAALARNLQDELGNLERLQPERYVVATSVPLSAHQKDRLLEILSPW